MTLEGVNASIINGEDGQKEPGRWIRGLSSSMEELTISGELRRHLHAVNVMERQRMQYSGHVTQLYLKLLMTISGESAINLYLVGRG